MRTVLVLLCAEAARATVSSTNSVTVFKISSPNSVAFQLGISQGGHVATGSYSDGTNHKSNFGQLYIETSPTFSDDEQGFAAGFVEGFLTAERTYQHAYNMACQVDCSGIAPPEVKEYFSAQDKWIRENIKQLSDSDDMWAFMSVLVNQLDGLMAGYAASEFGKENPMDPWLFTMVNAMGDLFDIIPATSKSKRPDFARMTHSEIRKYFNRNGHCSALIKATDDLSDIYVGHSSWFTYSAMLRIFKTYKFALSNKSQKTKSLSFSSYPGSLSSLDDMYLMQDSKMIMTQTTNSIFNASLWDLCVPQSLLAWHRVRSANQLADDGPSWLRIISRYNSGTYNNQYMILDTKLFIPGDALPDNTLFVVEQIPGMLVGKDATKELERGYFSSFNVPYHHEIYEASGYLDIDAKNGKLPYTEYQMAPRSSIFRRDQYMAGSIQGMQKVMRENGKLFFCCFLVL